MAFTRNSLLCEPVTEIRRVEGSLCATKEDAIKVGLELAKQWVDEQGI